MATDGQSGVPDILLERYLAGDLSPEQRRQIEAQRDASGDVRRRLAELEQERDAFLAVDPPEAFAHRLATRLSTEAEGVSGPAVPGRRRLWAWVLAPSAAAALTVVVAVTVVNVSKETPSSPMAPALEHARGAEERQVNRPNAGPAEGHAGAGEAERSVGLADRVDTHAATRGGRRAPAKRRARRAVAARRGLENDEAAGDALAVLRQVGESRTAGNGTGTPEAIHEPEPRAGAAAADASSYATLPPSALDAAPPSSATRRARAAKAEAAPRPEPAAPREAPSAAAPVFEPALEKKSDAAKPMPKAGRQKAPAGAVVSAAPAMPSERQLSSSADVKRVLAKNASKLEACVKKARARGDVPADLKSIELKLTIAVSGKVDEVAVAPKTRVPKPLARCLRSVLERVVFPRSNQSQTVNVPLRLGT